MRCQVPSKQKKLEVGGRQENGEAENNKCDGGGSTGGSAGDVLLQEATKLLKSLRIPQVRVCEGLSNECGRWQGLGPA